MTLTLTAVDFAALSPLFILLFGALALLLFESFLGKKAKIVGSLWTMGVLVAALFAVLLAPESENVLLTRWIRFDPIAHFFNVFFIVIGLGASLLAFPFFTRFGATRGEYFFFLLSALIGLMLVGQAADFLTLFLGIEILSLSLYVMCGYMKEWEYSHESALKYFFMGSIAAAFFLYGIALVYGAVGSTQLSYLLAAYHKTTSLSEKSLFLGGMAMITFSLAFKATIVPFHQWAPDVYDGAPTPVTALMAVGTKGGAFAALIRVFVDALPQFEHFWSLGTSMLIYPTFIYANIVALRQTALRRFFAYSGISHAGFLLMAVVVGTPEALSALQYYLVVYAAATLGSFAVLTILDDSRSGVYLEDLKGLFHRSPCLAGLFTVSLLTLAGIPPTAGFFAKFTIFKVAFEGGYVGLVVVGLLATIVSAFYYLRIITVMLTESEQTIPNVTQKLVLECDKIPGINDRKWACIDLILVHLRSLIRGNFRAFQNQFLSYVRYKWEDEKWNPWTAWVVAGASVVAICWFSIYPLMM